MKKNAFTLIELLAVIIIIGLLSVLIIPKVSNTLNNSKEKVNKASANALIRTADNYYLEKKMIGGFEGCTYDFSQNKNTCDGIEFSGKKPENGIINIDTEGNVSMSIKYDDNCFIKNYTSNSITTQIYSEQTCNFIKKTGDEYTIADEPFLVIGSTPEETTLIAKYNLLVGNICTDSSTCTSINPNTAGYGKQSTTALGYTSTFPSIGTLAFSNTNYWESGVGTTYPGTYDTVEKPYIYDSNSNLKTLVDNYKTQLNNNDGNIKEARLLKYQEMRYLGCNSNNDSCPEWLRNTSFWIGSAYNDSYVWLVGASYGKMHGNIYSNDYGNGLRPVIVVNTSDL
jgi:prepilin-type N-terminal cleavage/methylation domain-containing protein